MSSLTLVYFPVRGRAEPIRLLLHSLGLPFEEQVVTRETWPTVKAGLPLGQLPVLITRDDAGGEQVVPQSQAILRHLARAHGRYGASEAAMLFTDVVAETAHDTRAVLAPFLGPTTAGKDLPGLAAALRERLPLGLARLQTLYASTPGPLFGGALPSVADCLVFDLLGVIDAISPASLDAFPGLRDLQEAMGRHPSLRDYLASRGPSELAPLGALLQGFEAAGATA